METMGTEAWTFISQGLQFSSKLTAFSLPIYCILAPSQALNLGVNVIYYFTKF